MSKKLSFPPVLSRALDALGQENRRKIIQYIVKQGKISFSDLIKFTGLKSSTLTFHLRELMKASLINNFYVKLEEKRNYSYYELTSFGKDFLKAIGLFNTI